MKPAYFERFFKRYIWGNFNTRSTLKNPEDWLLQWAGGNNDGGVAVTSNSSLTFSAYWRCVKIVSEIPAKLPVSVMEKTASGKEVAINHDVHFLLHSEPNDLITPFQLRKVTQMNSAVRGNGLIGINRNGFGLPVSLEIIPREFTEIKVQNGKVFYHQKKNFLGESIDKVWSHTDVVNIPNFSSNGILGLSTIAHHRNTIGLGLNSQKAAGQFYGKGAQFSGYLKVPQEIGRLQEKQVERLKDTWSSSYHGIENAYTKTPLLEGGVEFVPVTMPMKDAQFLETRRYTGLQMCQIFGVPPTKIYDLEKATLNNFEHLGIEFYLDDVLAILENWEQELNKKLFLSKDKGKYFCKFNFKALLRGDIKSQGEFYTKMVQNGIYNRNEVRNYEDDNKIPGGDLYTVQMQMTELQNATKNNNDGN